MIGALAEIGWWPDWRLFGDSVVVAMALGVVLPQLGVLLVLRQQWFVTAAIGQAANLGVACALALGGGAVAVGGAAAPWSAFSGLAFAAATTWLALHSTSVGSGVGGGELEARSVWLFVFGGAGTLVLLADDPHGLVEVQRRMLSSLLAVEPLDVGVAVAVATVATLWHVRAAGWLGMWAIDPPMAAASGVGVRKLDLLVGVCGGALLGWSLQVAGLLFTFAVTVMPALAARDLCRSLSGVRRSTPWIGAGGAALGIAVGHRFDLPPGQTAAAVLAVVAAGVRAARPWLTRRS